MGTTHYSLPLPPKSTEVLFRSSKVESAKIRVVIPVHNDWRGLKITLDSLKQLNPRPGKITVVNDNIDNSTPEWLASYPVEVIDYEGNRGPAYARNQGCGNPDLKFDWIYFTDCGCRHAKNLILHFLDARQKRGDSVIAICGSVTGKGSGVINRYMTEMDILNPPFENELGTNGEIIPQAIITSNALVYSPAFHQLGGFSTDFCEAGGEDLDLGIRLRELGTLVYVPAAIVSHEFEEDIQDFKKRFERYGRGNRYLEQKHKLPSLRPKPFSIANVEFSGLAKLQTESLCKGYDEVKEDKSRIDISYLDNIDNIDASLSSQSKITKDVETAKWHLPEGTKLRLGKGKTNDVKYSPDGNQRTVASSIGIWIYDTHTGEEVTILTGHTGSVLSIAYSPDSMTLASGSEDKTIRFWDTHTGTHKFTLRKHKESITALTFSPDGNTLISGSADGTVHVWDAHTGNYKSTLKQYIDAEYGYPLYGHVTALDFSPDGNMFVSTSEGGTNEKNDQKYIGTVHFWETETRFGQNQCLTTLRGNFTAFSFNSDGNMFATARENGIIELRIGISVQSINENKVTLQQKSQEAEVYTLAFSPDSRTLVGGSKDGSIEVWDTSTQRHITTLKGHSSVVSSVDFNPDGATLISECQDGTIRLWDTNTGQSETIYTEHLAMVNSIEFSPDGQTLISRNGARSIDSDTLHLWDVGTGTCKATFTAYSYHIGSAEFSPDSRTLVIWSKTGAIELWDVETCLPKITFAEKLEEVTSIIFSPDSRMLASWNSNSIVIWDVETGKHKVKIAPDGMGPVKSVHLSPDNHRLISISEDETDRHFSNKRDAIQLWEVETGERKVISTEDGNLEVKPILLSPDNRTLISISTDKSSKSYRDSDRYSTSTIHLWDVETGKPEATLSDEKIGEIKSVLFGPDNRTLISLSQDGDRYSSNEYKTTRLWDLETGKSKITLTEGLNKSVFLSLDNRTLISISKDKSSGSYGYSNKNSTDVIHLWDVETGQESKATLTEGLNNVKFVLLSPDNRTLVSVSTSERRSSYLNSDEASADVIRLWDMETGEPKATLTEDGSGKVKIVEFSTDSRTLISINENVSTDEKGYKNDNDIIHFWDVETGEPKKDPIGNITAIALSSGGNIIANGNDVGTILLW